MDTMLQAVGLPEAYSLLPALLASIRDAMVTTNAAGRVLRLNAAAHSLTGWTEADAIGRRIEEVINLREYGTDNPHPNPAYGALRDRRVVEDTGHSLLVGRDGRRIGMHLKAVPMLDGGGRVEGCLVLFHDASEAIRLAERMSYLGQHDTLTGLPNRILLVDRLEQATRLADRNSDHLAVIFLDLDNFHQVNEAHDHAAADQVLRELAYRLCDALRESDTVCRLGADEFVILLRGVHSYTSVEGIAAKLLRVVATPHMIGQETIEITCSMGISLYPRDASDAETLMHMADGAMHRAKHGGRNRYLFAQPE